MRRLRKILRRPECHLLLFLFGLTAFGGWILACPDFRRPERIFLYLFSSWAAVILILFFIGRSLKRTP